MCATLSNIHVYKYHDCYSIPNSYYIKLTWLNQNTPIKDIPQIKTETYVPKCPLFRESTVYHIDPEGVV